MLALSCGGPTFAQAVEMGAKPSLQDINNALSPKPGTAVPAGQRTRSIVFGAQQQPVHEPPAPTARFRVEFELNSAELTPAAKETLAVLGQALAGDQLAQFRFRIDGHTDARGSEELNANLSVRRADSVRRYLTDNFGIAASRLTAEGYGASRPLDPSHPLDGKNRRVEIVNIGGK
jgi:outer membrane protein OmpA-like peptidoglycan-associated protein